jgi:hypothetical protein
MVAALVLNGVEDACILEGLRPAGVNDQVSSCLASWP